MEYGWQEKSTCLRTLVSDIGTRPPKMTLDELNRFRSDVGLFRSCLLKWGVAPSAAYACGAEEQTIHHVVLHCPIY